MSRYKKNRRSWTDQQLIAAVEDCDTITSVVERLGLSKTAAGNHGTVKKYIEELNLDTSHFVGQSWVGTRVFYPNKIAIKDILIENSSYKTHHLRVRLLKEGFKSHQCENCSLTTWLGQPIALELDHINGVSNDHRLDNLRLLCPNCHAQTPTWRGRNKSREL